MKSPEGFTPTADGIMSLLASRSHSWLQWEIHQIVGVDPTKGGSWLWMSDSKKNWHRQEFNELSSPSRVVESLMDKMRQGLSSKSHPDEAYQQLLLTFKTQGLKLQTSDSLFNNNSVLSICRKTSLGTWSAYNFGT